MAAEDFFSRWSKKKTDEATNSVADSVAASEQPPLSTSELVSPDLTDAARPLPTHEDVANLTHDSDFSSFMAKGVDESVKLSAMKKLFTNPHFNVMDGLDIYIGDYNTFEPITPEILASLNHAKALLDPSSQFESSVMQLLQNTEEQIEQSTDVVAPPDSQPEQSETQNIAAESDKKEDTDERVIPVSVDVPEKSDVDHR
jgi:hypothetical protein